MRDTWRSNEEIARESVRVKEEGKEGTNDQTTTDEVVKKFQLKTANREKQQGWEKKRRRRKRDEDEKDALSYCSSSCSRTSSVDILSVLSFSPSLQEVRSQETVKQGREDGKKCVQKKEQSRSLSFFLFSSRFEQLDSRTCLSSSTSTSSSSSPANFT